MIGAVIDALHGCSNYPPGSSGSVATNFYGVPRSTRDADFVIQLPPGALGALRERFAAPLRLDPQAEFEGVTGMT